MKDSAENPEEYRPEEELEGHLREWMGEVNQRHEILTRYARVRGLEIDPEARDSLEAVAEVMERDLSVGVKVGDGGQKGGRVRKGQLKGPSVDELKAQVEEELRGRRSWSDACRRVGKRTGLSKRTVQRRIPRASVK